MSNDEPKESGVDPVLEQRLAYARSSVRKPRTAKMNDLLSAEQRQWRIGVRAKARADADLDAVLDVWMRVATDEVRELCRPAKISHGTLVIHCADAGARHSVDRLLGAGALVAMKEVVPAIRRVRTVVTAVRTD